MLAIDRVHQGDCVELLGKLPPESVDLAFADPPFNIGYDYDVYHDRHSDHAYLDWSHKWMSAVRRVLKRNGTFWLAIGDEYAAELKLLAQNELGFTCRSWVIWYYTFGVNCTKKFSRSHAHLFHFVRDPKNFTFNAFDPEIRVPSARQLVYADNRANPRGRLPDDTWILRPQDVPDGFAPSHDTVYFPRVAGTFKERAGFHGCQMPEQLLGRIIRVSSNPGDDIVLDPFTGSGTTLTVAKKLGRHWIGTELSPEYARQSSERIERARVGEALNGSAEPLQSAPATPNRGELQSRPTASRNRSRSFNAVDLTPPEGKRGYSDDERCVVEAFLRSRDGWASDWLFLDPELNERYLNACRDLGAGGDELAWNLLLMRLRKAGRLPQVELAHRRHFSETQRDPYSFASEIAWSVVSKANGNVSLDRILCEPRLAQQFDQAAMRYAPGFSPIEYRSAAVRIRKLAYIYRARAAGFPNMNSKPQILDWRPRSWLASRPWSRSEGVYILRTSPRQVLYVGQTLDLSGRFDRHLSDEEWTEAAIVPDNTERTGMQSRLIREFEPPLNSGLLMAL
jgi:site-specific DNA-methyltransferase (adenine-specific)